MLQNDLVIPGERMERIDVGRGWQGEGREGTEKRGTMEEQNEKEFGGKREEVGGGGGRDEDGGKGMERKRHISSPRGTINQSHLFLIRAETLPPTHCCQLLPDVNPEIMYTFKNLENDTFET